MRGGRCVFLSLQAAATTVHTTTGNNPTEPAMETAGTAVVFENAVGQMQQSRKGSNRASTTIFAFDSSGWGWLAFQHALHSKGKKHRHVAYLGTETAPSLSVCVYVYTDYERVVIAATANTQHMHVRLQKAEAASTQHHRLSAFRGPQIRS